MNKFEQLVEDLKSGELNLYHLDVAVMEWIKWRQNIPEGIKNLLAEGTGDGAYGGLIRTHFRQIKKTIGAMELAYRRGVQEGEEETLKKF